MSERYRVRSIGDRELRPESLMMSYGYAPALSEGAIKSPIFQTSTFVFASAEDGKAFFEVAYGLREQGANEDLGLIYSRLNNPDLEILEDRLTLWDQAGAAAVFESGMAAISTTIMTFLRPGSILLFSEPVYGGTQHFFRSILTEFGIEVRSFRASDGIRGLEVAARQAAAEGHLAMIYLETPANPTNHLVDIEAAVALAGELSSGDAKPSDDPASSGLVPGPGARTLVAVDNTFLGPLFQHPLAHGADLVLYSLTKYVGGHSDLIAGACLGSVPLIRQVKGSRTFFGSMAGPWTGWLLMRSLETLKLRMEAQATHARILADWLRDHPTVLRVFYPGHLEPGDDGYETFRRQCHSGGGMLSFEVPHGEAGAFRFLNALGLVKLAVSLGGTESLAEHPSSMTHADIPPADQVEMGITPGLVRLSVGVEDPEDLKADLARALAAVQA